MSEPVDMLGMCCIVCGRWRGYATLKGGAHHMPPKGSGGEAAWHGNLLALCGTGTTGCHGLWHAKKLKLEWRNERWMWRGENSRGVKTDIWTSCHDDRFWNVLAGW